MMFVCFFFFFFFCFFVVVVVFFCFVLFFFFRISDIFLFLVKTMIFPKYKLANFTFLGVKDLQIWPEKEVNPLRG